jgi:hypothetical protein
LNRALPLSRPDDSGASSGFQADSTVALKFERALLDLFRCNNIEINRF